MSLLQMSVAGAVMILVITVIRILAINRVPKKTFLVLWGIALVRLLIPFSFPSRFSIYSVLERETPTVVKDIPAVKFLPMIPTEHIAAVSQQTSAPAITVSVWEIVWMAGFILCAVFFISAYLRCYKEFQTSLPTENTFTRRWLQTHPLKRRISIRESSLISAPLTFGVLRPVILMPKKTDWENEIALQYVLKHEFVHIRRFDTVTKFLLIIAVCVHWFNPLVWVMYILANRDIELSCDETVVHQFGHNTRAAYAKILIGMEETKSGFTPLCNHFSRNAIEERITAIMKTRKTTIISFVLAVVLIAGTVTVFATSAQTDESGIFPVEGVEAFESSEELKPSADYLAAGITYKKNMWYYQGKSIASIYDDNGSIYTNGDAADGIYLNIKRDSKESISEVVELTKVQFLELVDKYMNDTESVADDNMVMSYVDPDDGKTYYSFDAGLTFYSCDDGFASEALTAAEYDIEWWTYDEYKEWLEQEKATLQDIVGEKGWTGGRGEFVWTQEMVDETIAMYESILEDIKNGMMYSKTVDGEDSMVMSYNPADIEIGTSTGAKEVCIKLDNGVEKIFGPYETDEEMLAVIKPFCEKQVKLGNMTQNEADEIISRYTAQ